MNSVYKINKGINKPIEFKGLKAQYIWYLAGGMILLMVIFAILYISGLNMFICLGLILVLGLLLFAGIYRLSDTYGEHGLLKVLAKRNIPDSLSSNSRRIFRELTSISTHTDSGSGSSKNH